MIPKKIHYIWLGGAPLPKATLRCIESWRKHLEDYEIILWNERNIEIEDPAYLNAIKQKKWAFCADVARLKILHEHGGIYLDTDMEIIQSLTALINTELFIGREDKVHINAAIVGCVPGNTFILQCLEAVKESLKHDYTPIPQIITSVYEKHQADYTFERAVYPPEYFYPYNPFTSEIRTLMFSDITKNTYAIHHWSHTWKEVLQERICRKIRKLKRAILG